MFDPILLATLVFGIWSSYTDIKRGLIKNYSVISLLLIALLLNFFITKSFVNYPVASIINIAVGLIAGIVIWASGLWSAADAKLFFAFNTLLPITLYKPAISYFPGISILANSFVPLFIVFFFQMILKTSFKEKKDTALEITKPSFILHIFLAMLAIKCLSYGISYFFHIPIDYFLWIVVLFTILWLIEQKFKIKLDYFFIVVTILSIVFFHQLILTLSFFISWMIFSCAMLFIFFLLNLSKFIYTQPVKLKELKEGMIPAEMIFRRGESYFKKPITFVTLLILLRERSTAKPIFGYNPDGIKAEDIKRVLDLYEGKKLGFDEIKVCKTMHFAPILFLGALLTYLSEGYFIQLFL